MVKKKKSPKKKTRTISEQRKPLFLGLLVCLIVLGTILMFARTPTPPTPSTSPTPIAFDATPTTTPSSPTPETTSSAKSNTYVVKKNDSLAKIGLSFCNNKSAWVYIAEDNKIYRAPYTVSEGQILTISCR